MSAVSTGGAVKAAILNGSRIVRGRDVNLSLEVGDGPLSLPKIHGGTSRSVQHGRHARL